jgi:putative tryptophan/tyrosine transport system substrate-binding protein
VRRRAFIKLIAGSATAWSFAARAQPVARMRRIGILLFSKQDLAIIKPLLQGLQALGCIEGKTVTIEYRDAEGSYERLPQAADELVHLNPDVIF